MQLHVRAKAPRWVAVVMPILAFVALASWAFSPGWV
jgi:hypothetical protein